VAGGWSKKPKIVESKKEIWVLKRGGGNFRSRGGGNAHGGNGGSATNFVERRREQRRNGDTHVNGRKKGGKRGGGGGGKTKRGEQTLKLGIISRNWKKARAKQGGSKREMRGEVANGGKNLRGGLMPQERPHGKRQGGSEQISGLRREGGWMGGGRCQRLLIKEKYT